MSYADVVFINNIKDILSNGYSDEFLDVRLGRGDGQSAHTIKSFVL